MIYKGSCHCGAIAFEADGELEQAMECNCSHCSRKGYLLWFLPREKLKLLTPESAMTAYGFNKHAISHRFCPRCGCAPLAFGDKPAGVATAAVNVRCLEGVDPKALKIVPVDGRSR
ncbi:MAG: GFA family protein [Stellaceae bacterium]